jgi:uncharacterized phage protein (TIGR02218 family)
MRTLPKGLQDHLDGGATTLCWCWKLTTRPGAVLGFTDHDEELTFDDVTYEAEGGFTGSEIESSLGLAVDNLDVASALTSDRLTEKALAAGDYDNAAVEIWLVNWQDLDQRILLRKGNIGEVSHGELGFSAEVRGLAHLLDQPNGRLFQYGCDATLGDQRCKVDLSNPEFRGEGSVTAVEDNRRLVVSGLDGFAEGFFARGLLAWASGANAGHAMEVKFHRVGAVSVSLDLWQEMSEAIAVGDAFAVTAGCDKQFATCRAKFANTQNFRGFPHMPGNDFVASYPNRDDAKNDGLSRT